jgi:heme-degrading monooxygenase HmoA
VQITVHASTETQFETVFATAAQLLAAAPGYQSHELQRSIESPNRYARLVRWRALEDHTVGFRTSPAFAEWRAQLAPFLTAPASVEHFQVPT